MIDVSSIVSSDRARSYVTKKQMSGGGTKILIQENFKNIRQETKNLLDLPFYSY